MASPGPFQPPCQEPFGFVTHMIHALCRCESPRMEVGERSGERHGRYKPHACSQGLPPGPPWNLGIDFPNVLPFSELHATSPLCPPLAK